MHAKTALAVAGSVLAVPSVALAAADSNTPARDALHPSGKLTHDGRLKQRLVRENLRLAHRLHRKPNARRLRTQPVSVLRERNRRLRARVSRRAPVTSPTLQAIAACESGGNPRDRHRQRVLRQVPVHAADLGERGRHRQPGGRPRGRAGPPRGAALRAGGRRRPGPSAAGSARLRPPLSAWPRLRSEFPVLERVAYLNAGTDGPVPRRPRRRRARELAAERRRGPGVRRTSSAASSCTDAAARGLRRAARLRGRATSR